LDNRHPSICRAVDYIREQQETEGCFFGRWGVNYIYGTWQSIIGPIRCGEDPSQPWIQRAASWLRSVQKPDGSFGESPDSYEDPALKGIGDSTASQTSWAAMALLEIAGPEDPAVAGAINWLISTQLDKESAADQDENPDGDPVGSWSEPQFTGTGFPRVFYLRYHMYRMYFPLMAIGRWLRAKDVDTRAFIGEEKAGELIEAS
jgi:squalene-hopene/tetraprenyl-beta-curcumene cyclase